MHERTASLHLSVSHEFHNFNKEEIQERKAKGISIPVQNREMHPPNNQYPQNLNRLTTRLHNQAHNQQYKTKLTTSKPNHNQSQDTPTSILQTSTKATKNPTMKIIHKP